MVDISLGWFTVICIFAFIGFIVVCIFVYMVGYKIGEIICDCRENKKYKHLYYELLSQCKNSKDEIEEDEVEER